MSQRDLDARRTGTNVAFGWVCSALGVERLERELEMMRSMDDGYRTPDMDSAIEATQRRLDAMRRNR